VKETFALLKGIESVNINHQDLLEELVAELSGYEGIYTEIEYYDVGKHPRGELDVMGWYGYNLDIYEVKSNGDIGKAKEQLERAHNYFNPFFDEVYLFYYDQSQEIIPVNI